LHEIKTAENCQIEKPGKTEIIAVVKIRITNQMMLILNCDFLFIVIDVYTQQNDFV